jgi:hypothetical protein
VCRHVLMYKWPQVTLLAVMHTASVYGTWPLCSQWDSRHAGRPLEAVRIMQVLIFMHNASAHVLYKYSEGTATVSWWLLLTQLTVNSMAGQG